MLVTLTPLTETLVVFQELTKPPRLLACQQKVPAPSNVNGIVMVEVTGLQAPPVVGDGVSVGPVVGVKVRVGVLVITGGMVGVKVRVGVLVGPVVLVGIGVKLGPAVGVVSGQLAVTFTLTSTALATLFAMSKARALSSRRR